jgi:hypothetical protein
LSKNNLTALDSGLFDGLISLKELDLSSNNLVKLDRNIFGGLVNLETVYLGQNVPIVDLERVISIVRPDYIVTVITNSFNKKEWEFFKAQMIEYSNNSTVLISGKPAFELENNLAPNIHHFKSLADLYKPPLYGKCKKLFERFNRKFFADKPHKAFVYSFDGESAYCADAYTDKGQEAAEEIVLRECESHHSGSGKYSPCRIYASE